MLFRSVPDRHLGHRPEIPVDGDQVPSRDAEPLYGPHGGGVLTGVAERLQIQMVTTPPYAGKFSRAQVEHELNRFFYDTAQVANAVTIEALAKLVPASQIVFGSDFPYRTSAEHVSGLAQRFKGRMLRGIERDNAARILPRVQRV